MIVPGYIPSPSSNGLQIGPFFVHAYGLAYVFAVAAAILVTRELWKREGGDPKLPQEIAIWAFPAGLIGGRIYFLITTPSQIPPHWWGPFAIWKGGLGIWGGIAGGVIVGVWYVHRRLDRAGVRRLIDAAAPGLLCAQAVGRIGNYFNQELFGKPSTLPWALKIDPAHRPPGYERYATFQPTFLYEIVWNLLLAGVLAWLVRRHRFRAPGVFALYVAGYSGFRIFEESLRIDYSNYVLGMRLNFWIALLGFLAGLAWFVAIQRGWGLRGRKPTEPRDEGEPRSVQPDDSGATPRARPDAERVA
jgi:prolipoprotein diacylglyceryl transferase